MPDVPVTPLPELVRRVAVTQATVNHWKRRPFKWGTVDCARMVASHLRAMGHVVKLPPAGSYRSMLAARRRLADRGYVSMADAIDALGLQRIAPAAARVGDVISLPSDDALGAVGIAVGMGRILGFHEDADGAEIIQPVEYVAAWRVPII